MRQLITFAETGTFTQDLLATAGPRPQLERAPCRPAPQCAAARGKNLRPISPDFAAICDQFDRADTLLAGLRIRVRSASCEGHTFVTNATAGRAAP
jgi:hypothetical protein